MHTKIKKMDASLIEILQKHTVWPSTPDDTFRQTCGGKHGNILIPLWDVEQRTLFTKVLSETKIWASVFENSKIETKDRTLYELPSGKRLDCLAQVHPKGASKFAVLIQNQLDFNQLMKCLEQRSLALKLGRFHVFKRGTADYQIYFPDFVIDSFGDKLSVILKEIEMEIGPSKIDRRIYTGCLQFPGCFANVTNINTQKDVFKFLVSFPSDGGTLNTLIEDIILLPHPSTVAELSPPKPNKMYSFQSLPQKRPRIDETNDTPNSISISISNNHPIRQELPFTKLDSFLRHIAVCATNEYDYWFQSALSLEELQRLVKVNNIEISENVMKQILLERWGFQTTNLLVKGQLSKEVLFICPKREHLLSVVSQIELWYQKNLNIFQSPIDVRDLNKNHTVTSYNATVTTFFGKHIHMNLCDLFFRYDAFVGCVAWLNDHGILQLMKGKSLGLVITKDAKQLNDPSLLKLYENTSKHYPVSNNFHGGTRFDDLKESNETAGQVRCMGDRTNVEDVVLMHNKFLVFGNFLDEKFTPKLVWLGSRNLTNASKRHRECSVVISDETVALSFREEWANIYLNSEPLNTPHQSFVPIGFTICNFKTD